MPLFLSALGAVAHQLGNTSSCMITEVKLQLSSVSARMCCLSVAANPLSRLDLISCPSVVVGTVLIQSTQLGQVGWGCTEPVV